MESPHIEVPAQLFAPAESLSLQARIIFPNLFKVLIPILLNTHLLGK